MTGVSFVNKYNNVSTGLFKTNTSKDIGSDDVRSLVTDINDNYANKDDTLGTLGGAMFGVFCQLAADLSGNTIVWDSMTSKGLFGSGALGAIAAGNMFVVQVGGTITGAGGLDQLINPGAILIARTGGIVDADVGDISKLIILNN